MGLVPKVEVRFLIALLVEFRVWHFLAIQFYVAPLPPCTKHSLQASTLHAQLLAEQLYLLASYRLSFLAHYQLVTIHPWADGNGRMARLVMNMLQWEYNLIPVKVLNEQKAEYIQALIDTREQDNEDIFVDTMLRIHQHNLSAEIAAFNASMSYKLKL
mgnify:CR=1 FL=1